VDLRTLLSDALSGHRLSPAEGRWLMAADGRDVLAVAAAADEAREQRVGDRVTYVRNQNLHVTNVCKNLCGFCGFGRPRGAPGTYLFGKEEVQRKARLAHALEWLLTWTADLARASASTAATRNPDFADAIATLAPRMARVPLFRYHRSLLEQRALLVHALQPRLVAETLLIDYRNLFTPGTRP
jgi:hypothetical protein